MLSRRPRAALGLVVALAVTLAVPRAARADLIVERSDGAESCPDGASFAKRMREGGADDSALAKTEITVRFEHVPNGYRSSVTTADGRHRSLADDAPSCDGLADATFLAVKLALELEPAPPPSPPSPPAPIPTVAPPAPASADDVGDSAGSAAPPRASAPFVELSASAALAFGLASPVASGMRAGAGLVLGDGRWSIGVTGLALPLQTRNVGAGTVEVSVLGGGIEGCGRLPAAAGSLLFALCGRAEAMSFAGSAHGFARDETHARPVFAGSLVGRARVRVAGHLALFAEAAAVLPFARERFSIDTVGVVYDPPVVAAATGIGIVVDFE